MSMRPISRLLISTDVGDLGQEVRRLFDDLSRRRPDRRHMVSGECMPLLDVFETDRTIEVVLDLPGISIESIRIMLKSGVLLIVGEKERSEPAMRMPASFHLVERDFGRFARAIRVHAAIDASNARARLKQGELRVILAKIQERRGREILVSIDGESTPPTSTA
ncbi:MAG TPA: Hsp20/alpha crystallin family protein [Vicinamibacterales bacterium]|nr:Hsp20/alpha crystallin family protein [Vicinamibacterales bacterium]